MEEKTVPAQALEACRFARSLFHGRLLGAYLYGSSALGGLRPGSDLDILLVLEGEMGEGERRALTGYLLAHSAYPAKGDTRPLELTAVSRSALLSGAFPPVYAYQFGEWLRPSIEGGALPVPAADPDLVLLLWQARAHSFTLCGPAVERLLPPVGFPAVARAVRGSLPGLMENLRGDERNVLLTLARMWYTLSTQSVCPKDTAAVWAAERLAEPLSGLLRAAGADYRGETERDWASEPGVDELAAALRREVERLSVG